MTRPALAALVGLASYAALNIALSALVALVWQLGLAAHGQASAASRARQLVWLRTLPSAGAAALVLGVVVPAFLIFEPARAAEDAGPLITALALFGLVQIASALRIAVVTAASTRVTADAWLRFSTPLHVDPPAGVPTYAVDTPAPIVALVGVFSPRLVAARCVIDACTAGELRTIVAHERGHVRAHDNLKRWLMACAPDALRWTSVHGAIAAEWHHAAEDAADDAAAGTEPAARVDLAALVVKIARLTPEPEWPAAAAVSPFVERDEIDRRVRRLVADEVVTATRWPGAAAAAACLLAVMAAIINSPAALERTYEVIEVLIALGR